MWSEILASGLGIGVFYLGSYKLGVYSARKDLENQVKVLEKDKGNHQELLDKMYDLLKEMEDEKKTKIF